MKQENTPSLVDGKESVNAKYQLVLFDFDGTLCSTEPVDIQALKRTYQTFGYAIPSTQVMQAALQQGLVIHDLIQYLSPESDASVVQQLLQTYKRIYSEEAGLAKLFPGVSVLLDQLKTAGINLVIVSNKPLGLLQAGITACCLDQYFSTVIGFQDEQLYKPNPKFYTHFIPPHFLKIPSHEILMVGDTETDLKFARALSVDACLVAYGNSDTQVHPTLQPNYIISQVSELFNIIFPDME